MRSRCQHWVDWYLIPDASVSIARSLLCCSLFPPSGMTVCCHLRALYFHRSHCYYAAFDFWLVFRFASLSELPLPLPLCRRSQPDLPGLHAIPCVLATLLDPGGNYASWHNGCTLLPAVAVKTSASTCIDPINIACIVRLSEKGRRPKEIAEALDVSLLRFSPTSSRNT